MKSFKIIFILLISFVSLLAQVPQTISYQGVITDNEGNVLPDGNYSIHFTLYDAKTSGTELWSETQSIPVHYSVFNAILGKVTPIALPFNKPYWLGITIENGDELTPRTELTSSAYSLNTASIPNQVVTSEKIANGTLVRSINSVTDNVTLAAGNNVSITESGSTITIAASGGTSGDNLGNHTATENINLNGHYLSGNGNDRGIYVNNKGDVGIGTDQVVGNLYVAGYDGVVFEGCEDIYTSDSCGTIPKEGSGVRMMWYPGKAAFRAGHAVADSWDDENIGFCSIAGGEAIASGNYSMAVGGRNTEAVGNYSMVEGYQSSAYGDFSVAMGRNIEVNSYACTAGGQWNIGGGDPENWIDTDPIFEIGNGYEFNGGYLKRNAVTVLKNGNVGIGTIHPEQLLEVDGGNILVKGTNGFQNTDDEAIMELGDQSNYIKGIWGYGVKIDVYGTLETAISILAGSGRVGIGTESPSRKLFVNGDAGGTTPWYNDSDKRLKKNIKTIPNALDKVNKLRGVNYEWKDGNNHCKGLQMGFIAQEAKEIIPEVVEKKGEFYSMQYAPITALLVEAVKEQQKNINEQEVRIKKLEEENINLKAIVTENKSLRNEINIIKAALNRLIQEQPRTKVSEVYVK